MSRSHLLDRGWPPGPCPQKLMCQRQLGATSFDGTNHEARHLLTADYPVRAEAVVGRRVAADGDPHRGDGVDLGLVRGAVVVHKGVNRGCLEAKGPREEPRHDVASHRGVRAESISGCIARHDEHRPPPGSRCHPRKSTRCRPCRCRRVASGRSSARLRKAASSPRVMSRSGQNLSRSGGLQPRVIPSDLISSIW